MKAKVKVIDAGAAEAEAWNKHRMSQQQSVRPPSKTRGRIIHGKTLAQWASHMATTDLTRIDTAIRTGLLGGLDNTEIARKVVGSMKLHGVDGATEITRRRIIQLAKAAARETKTQQEDNSDD
jgi:hypothetical protein